MFIFPPDRVQNALQHCLKVPAPPALSTANVQLQELVPKAGGGQWKQKQDPQLKLHFLKFLLWERL